MSDVKDVIMETFDDEEEILYDAEKDFAGEMPEGDYPAHVSALNVKSDIEIKRSKSIADIYEVFVQIAPEAAKNEYALDKNDPDKGTVSGAVFVGREFKSKGIFKFKNPPEHLKSQGYTTNPGGNGGYRNFCNAMNIKLKIKEERANGKHLYTIPDINITDIQGVPVICKIQKRFWKSKDGKAVIGENTGKPMYSMEVTDMMCWEGGTKKESSDEEVPF